MVNPEHRSSSHSPDSETLFQCFARAWALATVFHFISYAEISWFAVAQCAVGVGLIVTPRVGLLVALAGLQVLEVGFKLPGDVSNHWLLSAFVSLAIICAFFLTSIKTRSLNPPARQVYSVFRPAGAIILLTVYFFAIFHKLNFSYFNPEISCAVSHYLASLSVLPDNLQDLLTLPPTFVIGASLVAEIAIFVLLWFPRTRLMGILIGLIFHAILTTHPGYYFYNFSAVVAALYVLFLSNHDLSHFRLLAHRLFSQQTRVRLRTHCYGSAVIFAVLSTLALITLRMTGLEQFEFLLKEAGRFIWFLIAIIVSTGVVGIIIKKLSSSGSTQPLNPGKYQVILALFFGSLVVFNGLNPYLGLRTQTTFSMFSNLRTEGGATNHLIVPSSWQVFNYQRDLVLVLQSSDPELQFIAQRQQVLTYLTLREIVSHNDVEYLVYVRDGEPIEVRPEETQDHFELPVPIWKFKLLDFRYPIFLKEPTLCSH